MNVSDYLPSKVCNVCVYRLLLFAAVLIGSCFLSQASGCASGALDPVFVQSDMRRPDLARGVVYEMGHGVMAGWIAPGEMIGASEPEPPATPMMTGGRGA